MEGLSPEQNPFTFGPDLDKGMDTGLLLVS